MEGRGLDSGFEDKSEIVSVICIGRGGRSASFTVEEEAIDGRMIFCDELFDSGFSPLFSSDFALTLNPIDFCVVVSEESFSVESLDLLISSIMAEPKVAFVLFGICLDRSFSLFAPPRFAST